MLARDLVDQVEACLLEIRLRGADMDERVLSDLARVFQDYVPSVSDYIGGQEEHECPEADIPDYPEYCFQCDCSLAATAYAYCEDCGACGHPDHD